MWNLIIEFYRKCQKIANSNIKVIEKRSTIEGLPSTTRCEDIQFPNEKGILTIGKKHK